MWLFGKTPTRPLPEDVTIGGMTATYDAKLKYWVFLSNGIEFNLSGIPFNTAAFDWAKEAGATIRTLDAEIRARVFDCLGDWGDKTKAEILSVDLNEYADSKTLDVAFVGDERWEDFGVNVIITNGKIVDVYGGD